MNNTFKAFAAACFMSTANAIDYPGDNCCTFWPTNDFDAGYYGNDMITYCHDGYNEKIADVYNELETSFESIFCGKNVDFSFNDDYTEWDWKEVRGAGYFASGIVEHRYT